MALDLERNRLSLHDLRLTAYGRGISDRTLEVTGVLDDFTNPRWQAKVAGDLDMRLLDPVFGYPDAPEGIAHLDLAAGGIASAFRIDGSVHVDGGSYIGAGVQATGVNLDAQVHADPGQLLITRIGARLRQGGQIEGTVALQPWLPRARIVPAQMTAEGAEQFRVGRNVLVRAAPVPIPVSGKVNAEFKQVALDTILDMVGAPAYRRLGFDARLSGPVVATWSNGDGRSVTVATTLNLSPSQQTPAGEVPARGAIDATYTQCNGGVDLRKLEFHLPASDLEAQGELGAYPASSASLLSIDFHSHDLSEFDAVLRSLGLKRDGKTGTAALPVALKGQADVHGSWTGSLVKPHLTGTLKATQLAFELPSPASNPGQPQYVRMDSVEAVGSYSPSQIAIEHAQFVRGNSRVTLAGTLDASLGPGPPSAAGSKSRGRRSGGPQPAFDGNSVLHARGNAVNVDFADVQPFLVAYGRRLPLTGEFNAQIQADGPLHVLSASGSLEMDRGIIYGEPVTQVRIQGTLANRVLKLSSARLSEAGGAVSVSGSYDFAAGVFNVDANGAGIDISRIAWVSRRNLEMAGRLGVSIAGSGSLDDPRLKAHATSSALTLGGQRFGAFEVSANTANRTLAYNVTTQLEGAKLRLQGQTALSSGYETRARLDFSRFNIGALLRMAHVEAFSGDSALAGTVTRRGSAGASRSASRRSAVAAVGG